MKEKIIKLGKEPAKSMVERFFENLVGILVGEREFSVELSGLKIKVGNVEITFEGRTKATIRMKK